MTFSSNLSHYSLNRCILLSILHHYLTLLFKIVTVLGLFISQASNGARVKFLNCWDCCKAKIQHYDIMG